MQKSMPQLEDDGELMIGDSDGEDQSDGEEDLEDDLGSVGSSEIGSLDLGSDEDDDASGSDGQIDDAGACLPSSFTSSFYSRLTSDGFTLFPDFDSADEEAFDMDEDSEDLIEVDEDAPYVSSFAPEPEELEEEAAAAPVVGEDGKRKRNNAEDRRERKKKRKQLFGGGAFGTYEDFQKLIEDGGPDDNI